MFVAVLHTTAKIWKKPKCLSTEPELLYLEIKDKIISTYQDLKITNYNVFSKFFKCVKLYKSGSFSGILN